MKIVNTVKLKEEVDYESLCRKLEYHVDYLTSETDRQQKLREVEKEQMEKRLREQEALVIEAEKSFAIKYEVSSASSFCRLVLTFLLHKNLCMYSLLVDYFVIF